MTQTGTANKAVFTGMSALKWYSSLAEPALAVLPDRDNRLHFRRYIGTPPQMLQPALVENIVCIHLGGAKRVQRWCEGRMTVHDVPVGALTLMPAQQSNRWLTHGPIDFGHIALDPEILHTVAVEEFDREPCNVRLCDTVGFRSPGIERLFQALLRSLAEGGGGRLYPESLLVVMTMALLRDHSTISRGQGRRPVAASPAKGGLADWRLRRVVEYMSENLATDIGLLELTDTTGLSRAQFFRAFKQSTGVTPHRYLAGLRLARAKDLLDQTELTLAEIAAGVGLETEQRLAALFRKRYGMSPARYRAPNR